LTKNETFIVIWLNIDIVTTPSTICSQTCQKNDAHANRQLDCRWYSGQLPHWRWSKHRVILSTCCTQNQKL